MLCIGCTTHSVVLRAVLGCRNLALRACLRSSCPLCVIVARLLGDCTEFSASEGTAFPFDQVCDLHVTSRSRLSWQTWRSVLTIMIISSSGPLVDLTASALSSPTDHEMHVFRRLVVRLLWCTILCRCRLNDRWHKTVIAHYSLLHSCSSRLPFHDYHRLLYTNRPSPIAAIGHSYGLQGATDHLQWFTAPWINDTTALAKTRR